jgi:hypothetical protein
MESIFTRNNVNSQNYVALQPRISYSSCIACLNFSDAVSDQQAKKSFDIKTVRQDPSVIEAYFKIIPQWIRKLETLAIP